MGPGLQPILGAPQRGRKMLPGAIFHHIWHVSMQFQSTHNFIGVSLQVIMMANVDTGYASQDPGIAIEELQTQLL